MASAKHSFTRNLAAALLAGEWKAKPMQARIAAACGKRYRWVSPLVGRLLTAYPSPPGEDALTTFLETDEQLGSIWRSSFRSARKRLRIVDLPQAGEVQVPVDRPLPELPTPAAVAEWLGLQPGELAWFADLHGMNYGSRPQLSHYRYRWVPKRRPQAPAPPPSALAKPAGLLGWLGGLLRKDPPSPQPATPEPASLEYRLLEIPKVRLKRIQRTILREILAPVPPHPAAHGFHPGGSIATNAEPHCGQDVVLKFDLADFFPSVPAYRVHGVFRALGYPHAVATVLTGLCTTRVTVNSWNDRPAGLLWEDVRRFHDRHLPQGAPTSPALANLAAYHLDCRLAGLAAYFGANYTRYADDITLSGGRDLDRSVSRIRRAVADIAASEGFAVNVRKTRVVPRARRQVVAGVVVNDRPNVPRDEFDRLKAILTNCVRHGPASQNRDNHHAFRAYLLGRVSHVAFLNPARGAKLRALLDRVDWTR